MNLPDNQDIIEQMNQSIHNMQDIIAAKTGNITQETYQDLKQLAAIIDVIKSLESQIETLNREYDSVEERAIKSMFETGVFGTGLYANNADNLVLVDDLLVTCEYCDGYALGIQKVNKPVIES